MYFSQAVQFYIAYIDIFARTVQTSSPRINLGAWMVLDAQNDRAAVAHQAIDLGHGDLWILQFPVAASAKAELARTNEPDYQGRDEDLDDGCNSKPRKNPPYVDSKAIRQL